MTEKNITYQHVGYQDETSFLKAWLQGVDIAGKNWFINNRPQSSIVNKWTFAPDYDLILDNLGVLSSGEAAFLVSMYSFFNSHTAQKMAIQLGCTTIGELASLMDEPQRRVLADLLISYEGW